MYKISVIDIKKFETRKEYFFESLHCAKLRIEELEKQKNTGCFLSEIKENILYTSKAITEVR